MLWFSIIKRFPNKLKTAKLRQTLTFSYFPSDSLCDTPTAEHAGADLFRTMAKTAILGQTTMYYGQSSVPSPL